MYKSAYGSTRRYAEWLGDDLGFEVADLDSLTERGGNGVPDWSRYERIIIGCPVVMNRPFLSKWIISHWSHIDHAQVTLFTTSGASPRSSALQSGYETAIPSRIRERVLYVPLPGAFNYPGMKWPHKIMLQIGAAIQKNPKTRARMRDEFRVPFDNVERMALLPIVEAYRANVTGGVR